MSTILNHNEHQYVNLLHHLSNAQFLDLLSNPFLGHEAAEHMLRCGHCLRRAEQIDERDAIELGEALDRYFSKATPVASSELAAREDIFHSIPPAIMAAAHAFALAIDEFAHALVGYSQPRAEMATASSSDTVLFAPLSLFRGGSASLRLKSSGDAILQARFVHPAKIRVSIYDCASRSVIRYSGGDVVDDFGITIGAGSTRMNVHLRRVGPYNPDELVLLVFNGDRLGGAK